MHTVLLFYFCFKGVNGSSPVLAAGTAEAMRFLGLTTVGAERKTGCTERIMGASFPGPGMRVSVFR
jgi:hypothetical protein